MYRILRVNTFPSGNIMKYVQSCHEMDWHLYKHVINASNVCASVSIDTKLYKYKIRAYDI